MKKIRLTILVLSAVFVLHDQCLSAPILNLPTGLVNATYHHPGSESYWGITLAGVGSGYDVSNELYVGWCVDQAHYIFNDATLPVKLYDANDDPLNLPSYARDANDPDGDPDWDMVQWVINHKIGSRDEVQSAIWHFIDGSYTEYPTGGTPNIIAMIYDAIYNGSGYVPGHGEKVAVILDPGHVPDDPTEPKNQVCFIEVATPTPEPGTMLLLGSGLVGLIGYSKLRIKRGRK